jgi:hypothetical protein
MQGIAALYKHVRHTSRGRGSAAAGSPEGIDLPQAKERSIVRLRQHSVAVKGLHLWFVAAVQSAL